MNLKLLIFLIGLIIFMTVTSFGVNFFLEKKPVPEKQVVSQQAPALLPKPQSPSLTGLEIAQQTALFLDKALKTDGSFQWNYHCDKRRTNEICGGIRGVPDPENAFSLSYLDLYKKTNEEKYKKQADKVINNLLSRCGSDTNFCELAVLPLAAYFKDTQEVKYKEALLKVADKFLTEDSLYNQVQKNYGLKLEALYQATGDKRYKDKLQQIADQLLSGQLDNHPNNTAMYQEGRLTVRALSFQIFWANILPAYRASSDQRYLKAAKDFFGQAKILSHFNYFKQYNQFTRLLFAVDSLAFLGQIDKPAYLSEAQKISQKIMAEAWDTPRNSKFDTDYGWLRSFTKITNLKSVVYNDWIIEIFLKMAQQNFIYE